MKKILLLILLSIPLMGQIDFTTFPKIGYGDLYIINDINVPHWADSNYYYTRQNELGIKYLWSNSDYFPLNNPYGIKILDRKYTDKMDSISLLHYCWSAGNDESNLPYQLGGIEKATPFNFENDNFGFGTDEKTSYWSDNEIGSSNYLDIANLTRVYFASKDMHNAGNLLTAKINPEHTWVGKDVVNDYKYKLEFIARRGNNYSNLSDTVAKISVYEQTYENANFSDTAIELADTVVAYITASQFNRTLYTKIAVDNIRKKNGYGTELIVEVYWTDKCDLYIDKFSIHDQYYEAMFLASDSVKQATRDTIESKITENSLWDHANVAQLYIDEPTPMYYRSIGYVSSIYNTLSNKNTYIHGAQGNLFDYNMHLANNQRPDIPYVMSNIYPFTDSYDTLTNGTQAALDDLVYWEYEYTESEKGRKGLKEFIQYANNYTPVNPYDDVPFIATLQVQDEDELEKPVFLRAPTSNEILAEGWLSLCYGAKGFMYYTIWTAKFGSLYTWGLMDYQGYASGDKSFVTNVPMVPNNRFYAVKELNRQIDEISSTIMELTWYNGFSIHKTSTLSGTYITSVTAHTGNPPNETVFDPPSETFVELGLFKKTTAFYDNNLDYFMVVNRRCLENEGRNISVKINKSGTGFKNWKVTDIGGDTSYVILDTGSVNIYFKPGHGKLFRLEPVIIEGGTLLYDETVPQNTSFQVKGNVIVPSGKTLTINSGSNLTFIDSSKLSVSGTLIINGTSNNKAKLDFTSGVT